MDAPEPPPLPISRRFTRRNLFRLAGAGVGLGVVAEFGRILFGSNEHTVIPGKVYRSAQLTQQKLERVIAEKHVRTVINLRGCCPETDWYMSDARGTHAAAISQEDLTFSAKRWPPPPEIRRLIEVFDRTEYPVLLHCARGADRTGLAATVALLLLTDATLAEARRQMWPRYGHVALGRTAVLDEFWDQYEAWLAIRGESHTSWRFREWAATGYCPGPFRAELSLMTRQPLSVSAGIAFTITIRATNRSLQPWAFVTGGSGGVRLRYTLHTGAGAFVYRGQAGLLARTVNPGESIDLVCGFPPVPVAGPHILNADMLDAQPIDLLDTTFAQYGSEPIIAGLHVG